MRLQEIPVEDVLAAKNWILETTGSAEGSGLLVTETMDFSAQDQGLFSAIVRFQDGSIHPGLVVKSFAQDGDEVDLYVHTSFGWLNLQAEGFMRAIRKYSHEIFPLDYYLGAPWKPGTPPSPDLESPHRKVFPELAKEYREGNGR